MAKVIGFDEKIMKRFTCRSCGAIVEYTPMEAQPNGYKDDGCDIIGLICPNCGKFHRTNP